MASVRLSGRGRRWVESGHPWVYAGEVVQAQATPGELVRVEDPAGRTLGFGFYSAASKIAVRMVRRGDVEPGAQHWRGCFAAAIERRRALGLLEPTGACRLIAGDADGVPGLVVDRYGSAAVLQSGTLATDRLRQEWVALLDELLPFALETIVDRSDASVRRLEGLEPRVERLRGDSSRPVEVVEGGAAFRVDLLEGQKTGAYLDQRDNRRIAAGLSASGMVLDAFAYEGWFGIQAARAGASRVVCLEQSRKACESILANARRNGVEDRIVVVRESCMQELRARAEREAGRYDLAIVDPPPFARNKREAEGAERGYVELNRRAAVLLGAHGVLVSASCSYHVLPEHFLEHLRNALRLAGREAWLLELRGAAADHPYRLSLPESNYLKCAFLRLDGQAVAPTADSCEDERS